jgi:hypothetical protein
MSRENSTVIKIQQDWRGTLHEDFCTFMVISRRILLKIRNVPDIICRENQNTNFMFSYFFPESRVFCEIMWKNMVEP